MFRLFRRRRKKKEPEKEESKESSEEVDESSIILGEEVPSEPEKIYESGLSEADSNLKAFIDSFTTFTEEQEDNLTLSMKIADDQDHIFGFISPEMFIHPEDEIKPHQLASIEELKPVTLRELVEGALFSIGRPIHSDEVIDHLKEDSATVKRTIRFLSKQRKKNDPIVITEISKDRWVMELNPIYEEFFLMIPESKNKYLKLNERRVLTEIAYRQPISVALLKKIIKGIGPVGITDAIRKFEKMEYIKVEKKVRSLIYTTTPKFSAEFGLSEESRSLKLQLLWRLKRLAGVRVISEEEEIPEEIEEPVETEDNKEGAIEDGSPSITEGDFPPLEVNDSEEKIIASPEEE